jgi:type II secretory pathway component PulF
VSTGGRSWRYSAEDAAGKLVTGTIAAGAMKEAVEALRARRLQPLSVKPVSGLNVSLFGRTPGPERLALRDLANITRRLSDLLNAGLPLAHALRLAGEQAANGRDRAFFINLLDQVNGGRSIGEAVSRSGFVAPRLFTALIAAGENLGALDKQFERLAVHYEEALKLRREIVAQLVYPIALVVLIFATLLFLSFFVLPQFETIFETADAAPPPETRFVIAAGALIRQYWALGPAIAAAGALAYRFAVRRFARPIERALLATPVVGRLVSIDEMGRYLRTLATLLDGGMPIARAMPLARETLSSHALRASFEFAEQAVRTGERLAPALARHTRMPRELLSFVEIGEETGDLAAMAAQAASIAENRVRSTVRNVMVLAAPLLTALMGLLTAGVIAAVMSGVLSLNDAVY